MDVELKADQQVKIPEPEGRVLSSQVVDEKPELRLNYILYIFFKDIYIYIYVYVHIYI